MNFTLKHLSVALAMAGVISLSACVSDGSNTTVSSATAPAQSALTRFATVPTGAEVTGLYLTDEGDLFFNIQHPDATNPYPFNHGTVGVVTGANLHNLPADFSAVAMPGTDADKTWVNTAVGRYQGIARGGDNFNFTGFAGLGVVQTSTGTLITEADGNVSSNNPDFNAYLPISANEGYLFTAWEFRPGAMSRMRVRKDSAGNWSVLSAMNIDFSSVKGTWVNCFGTVTPWGTPLTSEELYFDNTANWSLTEEGVANLQAHLGISTVPNPYHYGYIVEITNPTGNAPTPVKLFTMGRYSHENAVVMPDRKTVYLSDDGGNTVFFKFVADTAGDLTAGTLYAAKVTQDADAGGALIKGAAKAGFSIEWVKLAHATNAEIESWIANYDSSTTYITDAEIAAWAAGSNPYPDNRIAFLEARKAAKALGATAEFNKMEGVNINHAMAQSGAVPYAYMAMSDISGGMADTAGAIQLTQNKCGVVYRMRLDAAYNIARLEPVVAGGPYNAAATNGNTCSVDSIANPDNLLVMKDGRVIIGEDSGRHANNMIWVYKPAS